MAVKLRSKAEMSNVWLALALCKVFFMENIHATCLELNHKGILLIGKPGSGKSDLALRLIKEKQAQLIADDRTDIELVSGEVIASCPQVLKGLLEVRGLGIVKMSHKEQTKISLVIELAENLSQIERLPLAETTTLLGTKIKKIKLYPFELSAIHKVALACDENS